jgi:hypothetical protein
MLSLGIDSGTTGTRNLVLEMENGKGYEAAQT